MIYITQLIYLRKGQENAFHQFEDLVIPMIAKYKGRQLLRIRPDQASYVQHEMEPPYEVQTVALAKGPHHVVWRRR